MIDDAPQLSEHAVALLAQLTDHEDDGSPGVAVVVIPSSTFAARTGTRVADWMAQRAAALQSIGTAVDELRALGLNLDVATRSGAELDNPRVDRIVCVDALHRDGHSVDGSPPLDAILPGRGPKTWHDLLDPDERADRDLLRGRGRYYGVPECCIEAFLRDRFVELREDRRTHPERGYVLCDECAGDPERADRLAAEGLARRIAPPED